MPGTGEIIPALELVKSSWLQGVISLIRYSVNSGQLEQETVHTHTPKWVIEK